MLSCSGAYDDFAVIRDSHSSVGVNSGSANFNDVMGKVSFFQHYAGLVQCVGTVLESNEKKS